ncbi:MAG: hypothetical protein IPO58_07340 [Betaproteobacteria bacterium]|nr:hypothetical protein [Betaproteobacteria bacterium]
MSASTLPLRSTSSVQLLPISPDIRHHVVQMLEGERRAGATAQQEAESWFRRTMRGNMPFAW